MISKKTPTPRSKTRSRNPKLKHINKYVIFDLDETIGYFQELGPLFDSYNSIKTDNKMSKKEVLYNILDENINVFRTNIFSIFKELMITKRTNKNIKVILFTNNQGPKYWYNYIVEYINDRLNYKLFDSVIGPYKIGSTKIEPKRTSHNKSIKDICNILHINCENSRFLMFDDQPHTNMDHKNVTFILLEPYVPPSSSLDKQEYIRMMRELKKFIKNKKTHSITRKNRIPLL
jgi:hypothetical protein